MYLKVVHVQQANKYNIVVEPKRAVSDFEQATFNAVSNIFPN
ncbi:unnamed protein product, partial [Didymodactylos carnosus]